MFIEIDTPLAFCEKGKRPRNEDNIYPNSGKANDKTTTFLVCDGVGGSARGDLASKIVTDSFGSFFEKHTATTKYLHRVLEKTQYEIDEYILTNENYKGMGTTLTFLQFNQNGAIIAHAGDSRVYHFRGNKILFCTYDHSLVNDLKKKGMEEEARLASGNIITRAIQGASVKKIKLDIHTISDIQPNDYFLLCSDGVWGVIPDDELANILAGDNSDSKKIEQINSICEHSSRDNYSAYLIKIQDVRISKNSEKTIPLSTVPRRKKKTSVPKILVEDTRKKSFNWLAFWVMMVFFGGIGLFRETLLISNILIASKLGR